MKHRAVVVEREGRPMARVVRTEACQSCRACDFGESQELLVEVDRNLYSAGDEVVLEMQGRDFTFASVIAYGIPLVFMLAGMFLGGPIADALATSRDITQAVAALISTALGLLLIKLLEPKIKGSGNFSPRVLSLSDDTED